MLSDPGGGIAPWNVQRFTLGKRESGFVVSGGGTHQSSPLVFYHFHGIRFLDNGLVDLGAYDLRFKYVRELYQIYLRNIAALGLRLSSQFGFHQPVESYSRQKRIWKPFYTLVRRLFGVYNVYSLPNFIQHGPTHQSQNIYRPSRQPDRDRKSHSL